VRDFAMLDEIQLTVVPATLRASVVSTSAWRSVARMSFTVTLNAPS